MTTGGNCEPRPTIHRAPHLRLAAGVAQFQTGFSGGLAIRVLSREICDQARLVSALARVVAAKARQERQRCLSAIHAAVATIKLRCDSRCSVSISPRPIATSQSGGPTCALIMRLDRKSGVRGLDGNDSYVHWKIVHRLMSAYNAPLWPREAQDT